MPRTAKVNYKYKGKTYNINNLPRGLVFDRTTKRIRKRRNKFPFTRDKPQVVKRARVKSLTFTNNYNKNKDKKIPALPPGKRMSKSGREYSEYRRNRADLNKKKRL